MLVPIADMKEFEKIGFKKCKSLMIAVIIYAFQEEYNIYF